LDSDTARTVRNISNAIEDGYEADKVEAMAKYERESCVIWNTGTGDSDYVRLSRSGPRYRSIAIAMTEPLFLGLDLSTQQLKALLINEKAVVVHDLAVGYDRDLPKYGTTNGATYGPGDGQVTSPVAMWVEAFDLILQRMKDTGVDFGRIRAVSGAGQVLSSYALFCKNTF
jgi:glycerol kinase